MTAMKLNCVCPKCGEKTLETQSEVVWCTNLHLGMSRRSCQYGLGEVEETIETLSLAKISPAFTLSTITLPLSAETASED